MQKPNKARKEVKMGVTRQVNMWREGIKKKALYSTDKLFSCSRKNETMLRKGDHSNTNQKNTSERLQKGKSVMPYGLKERNIPVDTK